MRSSLNFFRKKKRGNVQEIAFVLGIAVFFTIIAFFGIKILFALNDGIQATDQIPDKGKEAMQEVTDKAPSLLDGAFLIVIVAVFLGVAVSAWYIDVNPLFFVLSLVVLVAILSASAIIHNLNESIIEDEQFSDVATEFPIMVFVGQNLFGIIIIMSAIVLITLYAKSRQETGI